MTCPCSKGKSIKRIPPYKPGKEEKGEETAITSDIKGRVRPKK
jgi:hypothetical protein